MWHLYMSEAAQLNLILQMLWAKIGAKIFWLVTFSLLLVSRGELRKSWTRCCVEAESKWDWSFDSTSAFAALLSTNHAKCHPRTTVCEYYWNEVAPFISTADCLNVQVNLQQLIDITHAWVFENTLKVKSPG